MIPVARERRAALSAVIAAILLIAAGCAREALEIAHHLGQMVAGVVR